jgi:DNA polymerase-1
MTVSNPKLLILVDGSSFLHRAFHAIPPLTTPDGMPSNAIYGVINMLRKLANDHPTDYFAVIFDAPGKTFRHDIYEEYKSHRPPMPDDLKVQIEPLHKLIKAMGLPLIMVSDVEADDVMGTLAKYATEQGFDVILSTGDKDMAQLVNDHVILENTMSDTQMDRQGVIEKFGVAPEHIVDYLALMGDTVDNIPGVPNVGPKTAAKWIKQYGSLKNLIAHADEIKGKVGENLRAALDQLLISKQLTTIKNDLSLPFKIADLKKKAVVEPELRQQLTKLGFTTWLKAMDNSVNSSNSGQTIKKSDSEYETVLTEQAFDNWLSKLQQADLFAFDTETTSLNYSKAEIVGVSFAVEINKAAYVPFSHQYPGAPEQLDREFVLEKLRPLLESPDKPKLGQNLKYDAHVLINHDISLQGICHDTMLESYVYNSTATKHNMDDLAKTYLGVETIHYEHVAGKGAKQTPFNEVSLEEAGPYAAEDADITLKLHHVLWPKLQQHPKLEALYHELEIPLIKVLVQMEENGVLLDTAMLAKQSQELAEKMTILEQQAHEIAGHAFNMNSPKQIQSVLYDDLKLPILKKTPKGQPSTSESVLQELAQEYPLPKIILDYRSLSKLKSTYTDKLPQQFNQRTGRVHTSYHQAVTATGRLSSSDPNLQNIPVRTEEGRKIRQAFIASPGNRIVAADYSQIELRIMAHLSGDEGLLSAFSEGRDIHQATAAEVFDVSLDQVTPDLRRSAKAINFGLIYGMSAFGLAQQLGLSRSQAQSYIDLYFQRYPGVKNYMDSIREQAKQQGYVETLRGRRLYLPEINSRNAARRQYAERTAINAPMQGTAADIIKQAMIDCHDWINSDLSDIKMVMQVHDELVFEISESLLEKCKETIKTIMCSAEQLAVPLIVDIGVGGNWDEAH